MKKQRKHYTSEEQVAILLKRHLVDGVPILGFTSGWLTFTDNGAS